MSKNTSSCSKAISAMEKVKACSRISFNFISRMSQKREVCGRIRKQHFRYLASDPQTDRTDCSALRAFLQKFPHATNESLCLLVERINDGSVKEWHQLTLDEQQKILRRKKLHYSASSQEKEAYSCYSLGVVIEYSSIIS